MKGGEEDTREGGALRRKDGKADAIRDIDMGAEDRNANGVSRVEI